VHTLFLLRHAQPDSIPAGGGDAERPLTALGRRQAAEVGQRLALRGVGLTLCSPALRTRQTFEASGLDCPIELIKGFYGGSTDTMRGAIAEAGEEIDSVLVIGHAPTVPALASELAYPSDPAGAEEIGRWYPPATLTEIAIEGPWADLADGSTTGLLRGVQRI